MYFPPRFDRGLAIELGELVVQAYAQHEAYLAGSPWELTGGYSLIGAMTWSGKRGVLPDWLRPGNKDGPAPIGFIARRKGSVFVIFRGTASSGEWAKNAEFNLAEYPLPAYGKAHAGFLEIYRSLRDSLMAPLSALSGKPPVYVAGHSLGGALATLAAPEIEARFRIKAVYTFGSPRSGDDAFVQAYNRSFERRSFRIANTSDIVTSVPFPIPIGMGGYFSHVETPVDFTAQYGAVEKNHGMETYLERLRQAKAPRGLFRLFSR